MIRHVNIQYYVKKAISSPRPSNNIMCIPWQLYAVSSTLSIIIVPAQLLLSLFNWAHFCIFIRFCLTDIRGGDGLPWQHLLATLTMPSLLCVQSAIPLSFWHLRCYIVLCQWIIQMLVNDSNPQWNCPGLLALLFVWL